MPHQHRNRVFLPGVFFLFGFRRFRFHTRRGLRPSSEGVGRRGSAYPTDDPLKWKMQACALREVRGTSACMTVEALRC